MKRRTRMVSIRLLDDEYERLKRMCEESGARCVSDMARDAMFHMLAGGNGKSMHRAYDGASVEARIAHLDAKVAELRAIMERLSQNNSEVAC